MLNTLSYLNEKFYMAVWDLATGTDGIRPRIDRAYHRFWTIPIEDFPENLREDRERIQNLITQIPGETGYIIPKNIEKMTAETASSIAELIFGLHCGLLELKTCAENEN